MNLSDPGVLKDVLVRYGLAPKKGLGQHFLCSSSVVKRVEAAVFGCNGILEIGPGPGALTSRLSEFAETIALELDPLMVSVLGETAPKARVIVADALEANLLEFLFLLPKPTALVSNLPYYITGPLLTRIAEAQNGYSKAVLMMQREVGHRVVAKEGTGERGSLSVYLQSQFSIAKLADVPPGAFVPPPKVSSVVLEFTPLGVVRSTAFFRLVRNAFTQPRKTLANNLVSSCGFERVDAEYVLSFLGFSKTIRAQQLSVADFENLTRELGVV